MENSRKIVINEKDGKVSFDLKGSFIGEDVVLICNTVILAAMRQLVANYAKALENDPEAPLGTVTYDNKIIELKGLLYDFYNANATSLLEAFAPEFEKNPDLTTQAILRAEDEIIEEKYQELKKEGKVVPIDMAKVKARNADELFGEQGE